MLNEKGENRKILRVIDANFNRCKEGLRVVEDIFRFIVEDDELRKKTRAIRHSLDVIAGDKLLLRAVSARNSRNDIGRETDSLETKRDDYINILHVNLQRAKESLRVLEEFFKIIKPSRAVTIKKLRYGTYALEKCIISRWHSASR